MILTNGEHTGKNEIRKPRTKHCHHCCCCKTREIDRLIREAHLINYIRRNRAPQAPAPPAALAVEEQVVSDELGKHLASVFL